MYKNAKTQHIVTVKISAKKFKKYQKKHLIFGLTYGIILKYAVIIWRETCDDAGGGPS